MPLEVFDRMIVALYSTDKYYKDGKIYLAQDTSGMFLADAYISNTVEFVFVLLWVSLVHNNAI